MRNNALRADPSRSARSASPGLAEGRQPVSVCQALVGRQFSPLVVRSVPAPKQNPSTLTLRSPVEPALDLSEALLIDRRPVGNQSLKGRATIISKIVSAFGFGQK